MSKDVITNIWTDSHGGPKHFFQPKIHENLATTYFAYPNIESVSGGRITRTWVNDVIAEMRKIAHLGLPQLHVIMKGGNNLTTKESPKVVLDYIQEVLAEGNNHPRCFVTVCAIIPRPLVWLTHKEKFDNVNRCMATLCSKYSKARFFDMGFNINNTDAMTFFLNNYVSDGVHLNKKGASRLAHGLAQYLLALPDDIWGWPSGQVGESNSFAPVGNSQAVRGNPPALERNRPAVRGNRGVGRGTRGAARGKTLSARTHLSASLGNPDAGGAAARPMAIVGNTNNRKNNGKKFIYRNNKKIYIGKRKNSVSNSGPSDMNSNKHKKRKHKGNNYASPKTDMHSDQALPPQPKSPPNPTLPTNHSFSYQPHLHPDSFPFHQPQTYTLPQPQTYHPPQPQTYHPPNPGSYLPPQHFLTHQPPGNLPPPPNLPHQTFTPIQPQGFIHPGACHPQQPQPNFPPVPILPPQPNPPLQCHPHLPVDSSLSNNTTHPFEPSQHRQRKLLPDACCVS